ncbi:MAG: polysaccharide pyruvyl transferase family protein [Duncaniella sp.]|nr:polysaccharide pyruvyl transferase family protein [Duncaniella sp.]
MESGKYILVYSVNSSTKIYTESAKLAKKRNLPLVVIKRSFCPPKVKEALATLFCIGPSEFIWLIKNAALVVTNSFHALVFSINLNTPFIPYLKKSDNVNSRLESILNIVGLDDHIVYESDGAISWPLSFDWTNSNLRLEQERKSSMSLLKNTLKTNS